MLYVFIPGGAGGFVVASYVIGVTTGTVFRIVSSDVFGSPSKPKHTSVSIIHHEMF